MPDRPILSTNTWLALDLDILQKDRSLRNAEDKGEGTYGLNTSGSNCMAPMLFITSP